MRSRTYAITFLYVACVIFPFPAGAQTVLHLNVTPVGFLTIPVSINGSGPYTFVVDTGSNRTLILNELLRTLKIPSKKLAAVTMANGVGYLRQSMVESVSVAGLSVNDLEIEGIDADKIAMIGGSIFGVLGEDFLKHFDVLIDNRAKTLTLDEGSNLAQLLAGDHLPLSFRGRCGDHASENRLVIDLTLPSTESAHFQIDSGTNSATLIPSGPLLIENDAVSGRTLVTPAGKSRCRVNFVTLRIGKNTLPRVEIASCEGITRDEIDVDGTLPTNIFDRLFISHFGGYAIVNPRLRKPFRVSLPNGAIR